MTTRAHPAQRARTITGVASVGALLGITGGLAVHAAAATTDPTNVEVEATTATTASSTVAPTTTTTVAAAQPAVPSNTPVASSQGS